MRYALPIIIIVGLIILVYVYGSEQRKKAQIQAEQANLANILAYNQGQVQAIAGQQNTFSQLLSALAIF